MKRNTKQFTHSKLVVILVAVVIVVTGLILVSQKAAAQPTIGDVSKNISRSEIEAYSGEVVFSQPIIRGERNHPLHAQMSLGSSQADAGLLAYLDANAIVGVVQTGEKNLYTISSFTYRYTDNTAADVAYTHLLSFLAGSDKLGRLPTTITLKDKSKKASEFTTKLNTDSDTTSHWALVRSGNSLSLLIIEGQTKLEGTLSQALSSFESKLTMK